MTVKDISFPELGIVLKNVPKSFSVFGFEIAFYGVVIGCAVLLGFLLALHIAKKEGQNTDIYWDFTIYAIIFSIIGARIYFVAFSWDDYKGDFWAMVNIRNGGLAIYGGVIAGFLTCFIFCKIKKLNPFQLLDVAVNGLILGQIIGRWANFFNRECFGEYTGNFMRMLLPVDAVRKNEITDSLAQNIEYVNDVACISVHPTFLYESLWNVMILAIMLLYRKHKKFKGEIALLYLGGYGLGRFFVEGLRTDQLIIKGIGLPASQLLGITLFIASIGADIIIRLIMQKKRIEKDMKETNETEKTQDEV